jgi:hypothetical protein
MNYMYIIREERSTVKDGMTKRSSPTSDQPWKF